MRPKPSISIFNPAPYEVAIKRKRLYLNGTITKPLMDNSGGYRLVGELNGFVVKCDFRDRCVYGRHFIRQTEAEIELLLRVSLKDRKYFPKIIALGTTVYKQKNRFWIIEKKEELLIKPEIRLKTAFIIQDLIAKYEIQDIDKPYHGGRVSNTANWGITSKNKPIIYDFGMNPFNPGYQNRAIDN